MNTNFAIGASKGKGITPVIAVILLLMITIALAGFSFVWFTGVGQQLMNRTGEQLTEQQRQLQMKVAFIDASSPVSNIIVSLRNSGTVEIRASELVFVVKDTTQNTLGTYVYTNLISAGGLVTNLNIGIACPVNQTVTITADTPGSDDATTLQC